MVCRLALGLRVCHRLRQLADSQGSHFDFSCGFHAASGGRRRLFGEPRATWTSDHNGFPGLVDRICFGLSIGRIDRRKLWLANGLCDLERVGFHLRGLGVAEYPNWRQACGDQRSHVERDAGIEIDARDCVGHSFLCERPVCAVCLFFALCVSDHQRNTGRSGLAVCCVWAVRRDRKFCRIPHD